ncbi:MAG: hypothetical protein M0Z30_03930 [Actinomycetota bacterium]|nr:hypothetical protein [Actinomycetota bacterium]
MSTADPNIEAFIEAAKQVSHLIASDQVAAAWRQPSAVDLMTVGALAGHLLLIVRRVGKRAEVAAAVGSVGFEPGNSAGAGLGWTWLRVENPTDLDQPTHRQVRHEADIVARWGWAAVRDSYSERVKQVEALLHRSSLRSTEVAGTSLTFSAYLATRVVELLVHADDLACSVGLESPAPAAGMDVAIQTMVDAARSIHGDLPVLRHLTRRERAAASISVF